MDDYQLRVASPKDAAAVEKVLKASYPVLMAVAYDTAVLTPVLKLITKANNSLLTSGTYYVAEADEGLVVGCGGWTIEKPPGADDVEIGVGHLRHFGTSPDWTRRGTGRAIFQQCESTLNLPKSKNWKSVQALMQNNFMLHWVLKELKSYQSR